MRLRPKGYLGLLLIQFLALGIALGATPAAWAQPWTTVGSAGTVDESNTGNVDLEGADAILIGRGSAIIRYNVVAVGGTQQTQTVPPSIPITMTVRYRAPSIAIVPQTFVDVKLIQVGVFDGATTTLLDLDSNNFPVINDFQTQNVPSGTDVCGLDFANNAYYIEVQLSKPTLPPGPPALEAIQVSGPICFLIP